jgi:squalene-hopene/tetraprenyl-beta-curcumene cyclase
MQNDDGGWPTFCRGQGREPFDGSGSDLTAHALRALHVWKGSLSDRTIGPAIQRGLDYLAQQLRPEGSWCPIWFGNPNFPMDENPVYGTAQVLLAYRDLEQIDSRVAQRGLEWLAANADANGGWGGGRREPPGASSVEETAMAVEALLADPPDARRLPVLKRGLLWLLAAVEQSRHRQPAPIGLHLARLWYHEKVLPLAYTVSALGQAVRVLSAPVL